MTDTINSAIEGWDIGSPKQETPHQDDVLAMSAPAVLKLPETVGSSSSSDPSVSNTSPTRHLPSKVNEISKPIMVTLDGITNPTNNPANKEQHIQPTRPPKEMNKKRVNAVPQATTDQFKCTKCYKTKTTYYTVQTRGMDEPETTFITCVNCNNHWKQ